MSSSDKVDTNNEIQRLKEETDRIFKTTKFNERYIWRQQDSSELEFKGISSTSKLSINYNNTSLSLDPTNENKGA